LYHEETGLGNEGSEIFKVVFEYYVFFTK